MKFSEIRMGSYFIVVDDVTKFTEYVLEEVPLYMKVDKDNCVWIGHGGIIKFSNFIYEVLPVG